MKYIIHTCDDRFWYVTHYLVKDMISQGISIKDIIFMNDNDHIGNLAMWLYSCEWISKNLNPNEGCVHLQDDVLICHDFYERTKDMNGDNIQCGFVCENFNPSLVEYTGVQDVSHMWLSFQCIYIPNKYMGEFLGWFNEVVVKGGKWYNYYSSNKYDDFFFNKFIRQRHKEIKTINLIPNLVEHIDYIIGGSTINNHKSKYNRSAYFNDTELVKELERKLLK